jgi:integrase
MPRPRDHASATGLLPRMEARVGKRATTYRYHPLGGKPINLGTDRLAAIQQVLDLLGRAPHSGTLLYVWQKYSASLRYTRLANATQTDYAQCWPQLARVLGHMPIGSITAPIIARYMRTERADAPIRANREKSLLSNLFAHGIDLGLCETNPAKQVRPNPEDPRTEVPSAAVLERFLTWVHAQTPQRRIIGLAARFASLAGCRKVEFLDLAWTQIDRVEGVVRIKRAKQHGRLRGHVVDVITIGPELAACIADLAAIRKDQDNLVVFTTRDGNPYTQTGFKTLWGRIRDAARAENIIGPEDRFTFHDLRAFYATQHKAQRGTLPDLHKNPATTSRVYDRNKAVPRHSQ